VINKCQCASGATVWHEWARAHPTSARVGREICTNSAFFWRSGGGGCRLRMCLKVRHISSMNTSRKCLCLLQIVYAYLASGGFAPKSPLGSAPRPRWGTSIPETPCAHPTSEPWLHHCNVQQHNETEWCIAVVASYYNCLMTSRTTLVSRHQKGKTILYFNEARDDGVGVALAGPYANHLHLISDRYPCQYLTTHS